ncbi:MAG: PIN domain-containing protein [Candidatus Altiarchaeota archaeon]
MNPGIMLDASAIIRSNLDFSEGGYYITHGVMSEINDPRARDAIDYGIRSSNIKMLETGGKHLEKARKAARKTGDDRVLSETDLEVIAAALEHGLNVASDDYAIQNTCRTLGIGYVTTLHDGIREHVRWRYVCGGCGKSMEGPGVCSVCGSEARRRRA